MDEQARADAVAAIASRHIETLQRDLRTRIALRLLGEQGAVSKEEVEERFAAEWTPPAARELADIVAKKTLAAVEFHRREVQWESEAVDRARDKVAKLEERHATLIAMARADAEAAEASTAPEDAESRLRDAEALAEYATARGDANAAPPATRRTVRAEPATGKRGA